MAHLLPFDIPFIVEKQQLRFGTLGWHGSLRPEFLGQNDHKMGEKWLVLTTKTAITVNEYWHLRLTAAFLHPFDVAFVVEKKMVSISNISLA